MLFQNEMGLYLTKEDGEKFLIPPDYQQTFHHEPRLNGAAREYSLVKDFYKKDDDIQSVVLEVLKFLQWFVFGTKTQLEILLGAKGINPDILDKAIEMCVSSRILNYFTISRYKMDEFPEDAFPIYCLDHGAKVILNHFSNSDSVTWLFSDNIRSSVLVSKYLTTGMFYLHLLSGRGDGVTKFKPLADFAIGNGKDVRFSAAFQLAQNNGTGGMFMTQDFILEVIRHDDIVSWEDKVHRKIRPFFEYDYWKQYYESIPMMIFLVQNDQDAMSVAEIYHRALSMENFRLLTDANMKNGMSKAIFYSYISPNPEISREKGLKKVRPKIFYDLASSPSDN